jgi:hypothetical protein
VKRHSALRTVPGLALTVALVFVLVPRDLPRLTAVADPAAEATDLVVLGLRVVATALAGYVAAVLLALVLSSSCLLPEAGRRRIDRWTERGVAATIRRLVGASALTLGLVPLAPAAATVSTPPVLTPVDPPADRASPSLGPAEIRPEPAAPPEAPSTTAPAITVAPGDNFWSLAEGIVTVALGRPATGDEVAAAWMALIEANRDRLVDPADPDLLLPGQVLRLPDPPPPRSGR